MFISHCGTKHIFRTRHAKGINERDIYPVAFDVIKGKMEVAKRSSKATENKKLLPNKRRVSAPIQATIVEIISMRIM